MRKKSRVAAYAVCVRDGQLLLARSPAADGLGSEWVLPGGGMEHGEDPLDTVVRELDEETGYRVEVTGLLGIDSFHHTFRHGGCAAPWTTTGYGSSTRAGSSEATCATR